MTTFNNDDTGVSSAPTEIDYDKIVDDIYDNEEGSDNSTIESDTNKKNSVHIPKERFDEVNNARKTAEEKLRQEETRRKEVEEALLELKKSNKPAGENSSSDTNSEKERIRRELREEYGVIGKEQLENILAEKLSQLEKERNQKSELDIYKKEVERLAKEIDGSDGRPPFNQKEVEEYAERTKIFNLEAAYEHLHRDKLREWDFKNFRRKTVKADTGSSTNGNTNEKIKLQAGKSILDQEDLWNEVDRHLDGF